MEDGNKMFELFVPVVINWIRGLEKEIQDEGLIPTVDEIVSRMDKTLSKDNK